MIANKAQQLIEPLLKEADIQINGNRPWDIQVHRQDFFPRVLNEGPLGLGESYMDGWWDCEDLSTFFQKILQAQCDHKLRQKKWVLLQLLSLKFLNIFNRSKAYEVANIHYNLGNDLFSAMLGKYLVYTCAYWKNASNLDDAQKAKLELSCQKLYLKPGMKVLDIGCGWGEWAKYAAEHYGVEVVGITLSKEQAHFASQHCKGLPIEIRLQDYRDVHEKFDRIVSLGMFEHVSYLNYLAYMRNVRECLKDDGLFLLHTIGDNASCLQVNEWTEKYIFPNSMLPSIAQIGRSIENRFVMEDWHNFGPDYAKTLLAWQKNFIEHWPNLKKHYDERFYRMWNYYLLSCAGAFRARYIQLWQIVLSCPGHFETGYTSIR